MLLVHIDIVCLYEVIPMCTNNMLLKNKSIFKFTLIVTIVLPTIMGLLIDLKYACRINFLIRYTAKQLKLYTLL